ncbi:MAG TPA: class I SAM-dependent methyltransferase [Acidimicrobiia bacterium]|nr:class I SAM-dependent methyltransferase [Acidimicrobiia bacterium]
MTGTLILRPGREASVRRRHPWIFSGAVGSLDGEPEPGGAVKVLSADREWLAWATISPSSQIRARIWSWDEAQPITEELIRSRVAAAVAGRAHLAFATNGVRLVFAENDHLPGVVADRYGEFVVVQLQHSGADRYRRVLIDALASLPGVTGVLDRSDPDVREGLSPRSGTAAGATPPATVDVWEKAEKLRWSFEVDLHSGHKTGFYLDQRHNRTVVASLAAGRRVLDVFCYTGGFTVASLAGGAQSVLAVDSSRPALQLAARNLARNHLATAELVPANAFDYLRSLRDTGRLFDLVIVDPPKLAASAAKVTAASRGYKDLNLAAIALLARGGRLVTFSCSGAIDAALFQKIVFGAALDARRDLWIEARLSQPSDHPVLLTFPEGEYLKGLVLRVG